jgi:ABC-type branched-subunit amino acid transport system ATPase component
MSAILVAENLVAGYGGRHILHGVSFELPPEGGLTVVGPNGSGKSTLLKTVVGLLPPASGRIVFRGEDVTALPVHERVRRGIGYVPQEANVFRNLTVAENLRIGHEFGGGRVKSLQARQEEVMSLFPEIAPRLGALAGHLSGGQRQMVAMATALMPAPSLLVLDEPSAGLSPRNVDLLFEIVGAVMRRGVALLMIEQNVQKGLATTAHGLVLVNGTVRFSAPSQALLDDPALQGLYFGGRP